MRKGGRKNECLDQNVCAMRRRREEGSREEKDGTDGRKEGDYTLTMLIRCLAPPGKHASQW